MQKNKFYIILCLFLFTILKSKAQLDTNYIQVFENNISVGLHLGALSNNFIMGNNQLSYNLNSNIVPTIAAWFKYKKWPAIAIAIPLTSFTADTLAKTQGISIGLKSQIVKGVILDGYFFFERGFNLQNRKIPSEIIPFKQSWTLNAYLEFSYIFNYKKFSYKSSYLFGEIQKKSMGTFTTGFSVGAFKQNNPNGFFPRTDTLHRVINFKDISTFNINLSGGYMHTFVFGKQKKWLINLLASLGPQLQVGRIIHSNEIGTNAILTAGIYAKYKISLAHNFKRWHLRITNSGDFSTFRPSQFFFLNSNILDVKLTGIYKF